MNSQISFAKIALVGVFIASTAFIENGLAVELKHKTLPTPKGKWIDEFGQNKFVEWKSKVRNREDLIKADAAEDQDLKSHPGMENLDEFRAWKNGPQLKSSGFFRIEKLDNRWWLVAPNGHLYYSVGLDCVDAGSHTKLTAKNKGCFQAVPESNDKNKDAFKGDSFSFYINNMIHKWGSDWRNKFDAKAIARSKSWGFTGLGNWSAESLQSKAFPYTSMGPAMWTLKKTQYVDGDIADAFDPNFESEVEKAAADLAKNKNDKYLIGYFVDNEMPWWNIPTDVLALESSRPCKKYWLDSLRKKYGSIANLNNLWGTKAGSFETLRWPGDKAPQAAQADMAKFRSEFAKRFYGAWYRAIKKADPNHLVLGSRIPVPMDDVVLACAQNTDVLSFNNYDYKLDKYFDRYYQQCKKPMLVGEYDFDSLDEGLLKAFVPVKDQTQRGIGYAYYTENAAAKPYMVGTHYFQYVDEPLTGRGDGESSFNGFVSVTDVPYSKIVQSARKTNARLYSIHMKKTAPTKLAPSL